ncbi:MAG: T9SS type A sorting domain-containing protein [Bacteroidota bacterium]|nr:T9SS type A sorting domain-containing protein [Bacteroidota bacterium]
MKIVRWMLFLCVAGTTTLSAHVGLSYPKAGLTFNGGEVVTIQWYVEIDHGDCVWDIALSTDGGVTWQGVVSALPKSVLKYNWMVPNTMTSRAEIRVTQNNTLGADYDATSGNFTINSTTSVQSSKLQALNFELYPAYPDPFNPSTTISYAVPFSGYVTLKVYDLIGRQVAVLVQKDLLPGRYKVNFNASNLASGMYIDVLEIEKLKAMQKLLLVQ